MKRARRGIWCCSSPTAGCDRVDDPIVGRRSTGDSSTIVVIVLSYVEERAGVSEGDNPRVMTGDDACAILDAAFPVTVSRSAVDGTHESRKSSKRKRRREIEAPRLSPTMFDVFRI